MIKRIVALIAVVAFTVTSIMADMVASTEVYVCPACERVDCSGINPRYRSSCVLGV
ncbi:MAG: hypothetical protein FWF76_06085 [Oscillospiraceae bacterium]|nr:hypothetical protein [Oscillospiraceae bacterium]